MILECSDVCFKYNPDTTILNHINLTVNSNDTILLTGDSGAGKTTLLHILGSILPPTSGKIKINGKISFIFQFHHLITTLTAQENIALADTISNQTSWNDSMKNALNLLSIIELDHRKNNLPEELSGGEKQRVALARALITKPDLLLCDEPTGSLDEKRSTLVLDLIFNLIQHSNTALILISHNNSIKPRFDKHLHLTNCQLISC